MLEAPDPDSLDRIFAAPATGRGGALMVQTDALFISHRRWIVALAARSRVPPVHGEREFVHAGGFMFYGASLADMYREAAGCADKILKVRSQRTSRLGSQSSWSRSSISDQRRPSASPSRHQCSCGRIR